VKCRRRAKVDWSVLGLAPAADGVMAKRLSVPATILGAVGEEGAQLTDPARLEQLLNRRRLRDHRGQELVGRCPRR